MSSPPYGWIAPPYTRWRPITDFCYVDEDNPGTNYHQIFQILREYRAGGGARGERKAYLSSATSPVAGSDMLQFLCPQGAGDPLGLDVVAWMNAGLLPEVSFLLKIGLVQGAFDPATLTWTTALALGVYDWMETRVTVPAFAFGNINFIWHAAWAGCVPATLIAAADATGFVISADVDLVAGTPDNFTIDSSAFVPNPITHQWAAVESEP